MKARVLGSILLIVAMSIGGGLLSLPVVTASAGFLNSTLLLFMIWFITTIGSLFILELCLRLPRDTNLISMARDTLGFPGQILTAFFFLMMLYCIMCVYISGGTDLVHSISQALHINLPPFLSAIIFVGILGSFVWHGIRWVDHANRALMTGKMAIYFLLVVLLLPAIHFNNLPNGEFSALSEAVMPAIFSFGYAIIIPSLCSYLDHNVKQLRTVILVGSLVPLLCFLMWNYVVQGTISLAQLQSIAQSGQVVSQLNADLSVAGNPWVTTITRLFTTICLLTAFLAVSLSLSDVIANGLNRKKEGRNKWLIYFLTFFPPLAIVLLKPYIFITAIQYAGVLVVALSILLPIIMVWRSRKHPILSQQKKYQVSGGNFLLYGMLVVSLLMLVFAATHI